MICKWREDAAVPLRGGAGESRTRDKRFRKPLLYPSELQPQHSVDYHTKNDVRPGAANRREDAAKKRVAVRRTNYSVYCMARLARQLNHSLSGPYLTGREAGTKILTSLPARL